MTLDCGRPIAGARHPPETAVIARKPTTDAPAKRTRTTTPAGLAEAAKAPATPRKKAAAAGPRKAARREPAEPAVLEKHLAVITESLDEDKAENVVVLDLVGRASFADRMVIATGLADRQIAAMAQHLERKLGEAGLKRVLIEGATGTDWVLIDAGDIVIHLFKPESRELYGLERMWGTEFDVGETDEGVTTL